MSKILPDGTTTEQWNAYYDELDRFKKYMVEKKPIRLDFDGEMAYNIALSEWRKELYNNAPYPPGYTKFNTDDKG
jgi:phosphotransacetylase